jgi:hypothetical protein
MSVPVMPQIFFSFRFGNPDRWTADHEFMLKIGYWFRMQGVQPHIWGVGSPEPPIWTAALVEAVKERVLQWSEFRRLLTTTSYGSGRHSASNRPSNSPLRQFVIYGRKLDRIQD